MRPISRLDCALGGIFFVVGCASNDGVPSSNPTRGGSDTGTSAQTEGGSDATGGSSEGIGGASTEVAGGRIGQGGNLSPANGGTSTGKGGTTAGPGSSSPSGGSVAAGGVSPTGGSAPRTSAVGGVATGGRATGGAATGGPATGGSKATSSVAASGAASTSTLDCSAIPAMPTGGTQHTGNGQGGKDNLAWQLWANNAANGSITTFSTPAFSAAWNNAGDYLARIGFEWGNSGKTYDAYGTITAQFAYKRTGTAGGYSYIGIYGWSTNPCIEWYIVDDSFNGLPFNPGGTVSGTVDVDGGTYNLIKRNTTGTGGNRCGNVSNWDQFYSIRTKARQCGTITVSDHFKAWDAKGWKLGNLLEVKILVEAGGGNGTVEFPVANVTKTQ